MYSKNYSNFVKPSLPENKSPLVKETHPRSISGAEAKTIYLKEVKDVREPVPVAYDDEYDPAPPRSDTSRSRQLVSIEVNNKELFTTVQNNDVEKLVSILDICPNMIHTTDEFGWSLLMIACQANSIETVKELLNRGVNTSVRDKAGNSAQSLVIQNKNIVIADLLLSNKNVTETKQQKRKHKTKTKEFVCDICNCTCTNKEKHLSSTIHNISASKGRKIPSNFKIPETNRGFQMMLRGGWDKESGLGRDGSGKKYPIKTTQKKDKKGLGLKEKKKEVMDTHSTLVAKSYHDKRKMEINFRREFY